MPRDIALSFATIAKLHRAMRAGTTSPVDLLEAALRRIDAVNPRLRAFITVTAEHARARARHAGAEMASGQ